MANEKRLIDANELLEAINFEYDLDYGEILIDPVRLADMVEDATTVDAVEVVHGRWIQSEPGYRLCSHCMADVAIYSGHRNYCPNCGADMRERKDND